MKKLTGSQKKYLRGLAHGKKPVVYIGQNKLSPSLIKAVTDSLTRHELIKVKCIDFKEKSQKKEMAEEIEKTADCALVGMIGHMLIFYREQSDPDKRKIVLPS